MKDDIVIDVMGNTSPFSLMGESSGYLVTVNDRSYLLECGTPVFPPLGYSGIARIKGIFATHSHEDHKRWFTDIVLFTYYNPRVKGKARLISAEPVLEEYAKNSKAALESIHTAKSADMGVDVINGLLNGCDLLGLIVRDFTIKFFFEPKSLRSLISFVAA